MACIFTGITGADCKEGIGGISAIYIGNRVDFTSGVVVDGTTGLVTALPEATVYKILIRKGQGGYTDTSGGPDDANLLFTQVVTANISGLAPAKRLQIMNLLKGSAVVFAQNKSGTKVNQLVMVGVNGGAYGSVVAGTGTASADANGYQLTLTAEEEALAPHLTAYTTDPFDNFPDITVM